jgi:hypothetical protein
VPTRSKVARPIGGDVSTPACLQRDRLARTKGSLAEPRSDLRCRTRVAPWERRRRSADSTHGDVAVPTALDYGERPTHGIPKYRLKVSPHLVSAPAGG